MKIDDLIAVLERVRSAKGNIEVNASSFCGTDESHVIFDIKPPDRKKFSVKNHLNGYGEFCLSVELSKRTREEIAKGVADMKKRGYRYFLSQFVAEGESPREGLSPCEWHMPW